MHLCGSLLFLLLGCSNLFVQIGNVVKGMQGKISLSLISDPQPPNSDNYPFKKIFLKICFY